jgi:hypothetical protein
MVLVGGCVAADPPPTIHIEADHTQVAPATTAQTGDDAAPDYCALATALAPDDVCSMMCDPDAMAAQLVADGSTPGKCYELFCALPGDNHVIVGVCLPPASQRGVQGATFASDGN